MRKIHVVILSLVALFALSALTNTALGALEFLLAFWLIGGESFTGTLPAESTGEFLLGNLTNGSELLCSFIYGGNLSEETETPEKEESLSDFLIISVLTLSKIEIKELSGEGLKCTSDKDCENAPDIEFWPDELPWLFYIDLHIENGVPLEAFTWLVGLHGTKLPGWEIDCLVLGILIEELCQQTFEGEDEVLNVTGGVEAMGALAPGGNCGSGTANSLQEVVAGNLITSTEGVISISSP